MPINIDDLDFDNAEYATDISGDDLDFDNVVMGKPRPAPPKPKPKPTKKPRSSPIVPIKVTPEMIKQTMLEIDTDILIRKAAEDKSIYGYKRPSKRQQMEDSIDPIVITGRRPPKPLPRRTKGPQKGDIDPVTGEPLAPPPLEQPGFIEHHLNKALRVPLVFPKLAESAGEAVDTLIYGLGRLEGGTPEEIAQRQTRITPYIKKATTPILEFGRGFAPQDPAQAGTMSDAMTGALASAGEFLLAGWTGKALGVPSKIVTGVAGAGLNINEALAEADKLGATPDQRAILTVLSGLAGLTEMGGLGKSIEGFGLSKLFKDRVKEVLEEGGQEGLQTWLNNLNMVVTRIDPDRPLTRDVLEAALLGGFVGGVFQGGSYARQALLTPKQQPDLPPIRQQDIAKIPPPQGYEPPPPRQRPIPKSMQSTKLRPGWDMMLMSARGQDVVTDPNERDDNLMEFLRNSQAFLPNGDPIIGYNPSVVPTEDTINVKPDEEGFQLGNQYGGLMMFQDPEIASAMAATQTERSYYDVFDHPTYQRELDKSLEEYRKQYREKHGEDPTKFLESLHLITAKMDAFDVARNAIENTGHSQNLRSYYFDVRNVFDLSTIYTSDDIAKIREAYRQRELKYSYNDEAKEAANLKADEFMRMEEDILRTHNDNIEGYYAEMNPITGLDIVKALSKTSKFGSNIVEGPFSVGLVKEILETAGFDGLTYVADHSAAGLPAFKEFNTVEEAKAHAEKVGGRLEENPVEIPYGVNEPPGFTTKALAPPAMTNGPTVWGSKVWHAFKGAKVKSATGNTGTFSATDPRVYRDLAGSAADPSYDVREDDLAFDVMPALRAGQAPYLRAPRWLLGSAGMASANGFNMSLDQLEETIARINLKAPSPEHAQAAISAVLDVAEQARTEGLNSISIVSNDLSEASIRGVIEHEVTHAAEREGMPEIDWVMNHPLLEDVLFRQPYGPQHPDPAFRTYGTDVTVYEVLFDHLNKDEARTALALEIPSYYVQKRLDKLGMTDAEGRQFFKDLINHTRDFHGQPGVDRFRNIVRMRQAALDVINESDQEWKAWQQELRERGPERSAVYNNYNAATDGPLDLSFALQSAGDIVYPPNVRVNDTVRRVGGTDVGRVVATHKDGVFVEYDDGTTEKIPWSMAVEAADPKLDKPEQVRRELVRKPVIPSPAELGIGAPPRIGGQAGVQQNTSPVFQMGNVVRALDHEDNVIDEDMTIVGLDVDEYGPLVRAQRHDDGGVGEFRLDRIVMASEAGKPKVAPPRLQKFDPTKAKERMAALTPPPSGPSGPEPPQLPPPGGGRPFRHPRIMTQRMDNDYQRAVDRAYVSLLEKGGVKLDPTRRVFTQVVDALEEGKITSEQFDEALEENGMTIQQFVDEYKATVHEAALTLYELSRIKIKYNNIIKTNKKLADKFLSVQDQFDALMHELNDTVLGKSVWQRGSSLIRMMMLSDIRTAFVNAWVTTGRIPLSIVNHGMGAFMHSMHKSKGNPHGLRDRLKTAAQDANRATQIGIEVLLSLKPSELVKNREKTPTGGKHLEYQQVIDQLIKQFPDLHGRLIAPGIGDVHVSQLGDKLESARKLAGTMKDIKTREKALNDLKKYEDRHKSNMDNWAKKGLYGAEWALEGILKPMRWQELLFRRPMFVAYLNYALEKRKMNFADLASRKELATIPEEVLNEAVDEALDFTYSYMPHYEENSPWAEKRAHEFINAINRLGPISAMAGIAFPRAVYNGVKFVYEYSPLGAMPYFVKKFRQLKGMDIIQDPTLPNVSYKATGSELTERDFQRVAKAMVGTVMFATAMGLIKAGLIGDEWWKLKVPFGSSMSDSGNPIYLDLRKFQPLSTFARLADMSMRAGASLLETDAFGRQRGEVHMGQELKEIFTGMRNFPGLEETTNAFFEMWDDGTGASWDKGMQSVGMSVSWITRPLINVRDAVAIFSDEEQKQKDLKGTNVWGPLVDNVPWLRSYLLQNKTDPNKSPVETMFAPALSFPMGAKMIEGENFAGREWRRLGLLNKSFLPSESDPIMNRARNEAFFEFMDEVATEFENDPSYLEASDADKAAMWEIMAKEARPIANEAGKAANPEEDAKAKAM